MRKQTLLAAIALLPLLTVPETGLAAGDEGLARKLMNSQGCKACHALEGDGGTAAPSFEDIRARLSRAEIRLQLVNQAHRHGQGRIPDFATLSEAEIAAMVNFMQPKP